MGPVHPEDVAPGLVASPDRGLGWQPEPLLGLVDLVGQPAEIAGRDGPEAGLLGRLGGESQVPFVLAEFQGDVQGLGASSGRHRSVSVCRAVGVLPDGDSSNPRYSAACMVSNKKVTGRGGSVVSSLAITVCRRGAVHRQVRPPRYRSPLSGDSRASSGFHDGFRTMKYFFRSGSD